MVLTTAGEKVLLAWSAQAAGLLPSLLRGPPQLRRSPEAAVPRAIRRRAWPPSPPPASEQPCCSQPSQVGDSEGQSAPRPGLRPAPQSHISPILAGAIATGAGGDACPASSGPLCRTPCHCGSGPLVPHWPSPFLHRRWLRGGGGTTPGPAGPGSTPCTEPAWIEWGAHPSSALYQKAQGAWPCPQGDSKSVYRAERKLAEAGRRHTMPHGEGRWARGLMRFKEGREGPGREMAAVSGVGVAGVVLCAQPVRGQPAMSCALNSTLPHPHGQPRGKGQGQ